MTTFGLLVAVSACTDNECKYRLGVAREYPFVQVLETSPNEAVALDLALDDGALAVGHGSTVDTLEFVDTTCSKDDLAVGRALFTGDAVNAYVGASVAESSSSHHVSVRLWNPGASSAIRFGVNADSPAQATAPVVEFVSDLVARFGGGE